MRSKTRTPKTPEDFAPSGDVVRVLKSSVTVDASFNVRQEAIDAAEDASLGESITSEGLLQYPVARRMPDGSLFLLAGFRRFRSSPGESIDLKVVTCDDLTAYLINVTENVQRKNLKPYELAERIALLKKKFGVDTKTLAGRLRLSESYVRNLVRLKGKLHPELWKLFVRYGESLASYEDLLRICALGPSEQLDAWKKLRAEKEERGSKPPARLTARPKLVSYVKSVEADLAVGRLDRRYAEGVLYGLRLALGEATWDQKPSTDKSKKDAR